MTDFPLEQPPVIPDACFQMANESPLDLSLYEDDEQFLDDARKFVAPAIVEELEAWRKAISASSTFSAFDPTGLQIMGHLGRRVEFLRSIS